MGTLLAATVFALAGCAAPMQEGGVEVRPGAGARMWLAMRYGMTPVGEATRPAEARRVLVREQLPVGAKASGRLGDYVLDNGLVAVVIGNIDGTNRSGTLVDLARWGDDGDDLEALETRAFGSPIRYETLKTGFDRDLGAAYVSVTGRAVTPSGGSFSLETRYDLAPALDAVLITTRLVRTGDDTTPSVEKAPAESDSPPPAIEENLSVDARENLSDPRGPFVAALGRHTGYALQPAGEGSLDRNRIVIAPDKTPGHGGELLYSRTLTVLERPDTLAAEVAFARTRGEPIGELEIHVGPSVAPDAAATLDLRSDEGRTLATTHVFACGAPAGFRVRAPAGSFGVSFHADGLATLESTKVTITSERLSDVALAVAPSPAPFGPVERVRRCPKEPALGE